MRILRKINELIYRKYSMKTSFHEVVSVYGSALIVIGTHRFLDHILPHIFCSTNLFTTLFDTSNLPQNSMEWKHYSLNLVLRLDFIIQDFKLGAKTISVEKAFSLIYLLSSFSVIS